MKISKKLVLLPISVLALTGCGKNDKDNDKKELPNAPVSKMALTLADFCYTDVLPAPSITGLTAKDIKITYSYLNNETEARIGDYVAGSPAGTINAGAYKLKADVKTSTYKPFSLKTTFNVTKGEMTFVVYEAVNFYADEVAPQPTLENVPENSTVSYKIYLDPEVKTDYVVGQMVDLEPGNYTLEMTIENANYVTGVFTSAIEIKQAEFDDAYALVSDSIDIGEVDGSFDFSTVNLTDLLDVKTVATDTNLEGVTFSWKETPDIASVTPDTPFEAVVIAHKDRFADKEYTITVNTTKKRVNMPGLFKGETGTEPVGYLEWSGEEIKVHLAGVNATYVDVTGDSFTQTNLGTYGVTCSLKNTTYTCWSDGSTSDKTFHWEIHKYNPAGHSAGYRLKVGDFTGWAGDTTPQIDVDYITGPLALGLEFHVYNSTLEEYEWVEYEYATFTVDSDNMEIDGSGKLVVNDTSKIGELTVGTSNANHDFMQDYDLVFSVKKTLTFEKNSVVGSDGETKLMNSNWQEITTPNPDYVVRLSSGGSGFGCDFKFSAPLSVKFKFNIDSSDPDFSVSTSVWFSKTTSFIGDKDDVKQARWLDPEDYDYENDYVIYNFSTQEFDGDYNFQFWASGFRYTALEIVEVSITYLSPIE